MNLVKNFCMIVLLSQGNVVKMSLSSLFLWKYFQFVQQMKCLIKCVISLTGCSAAFWLLEYFQMCKTHRNHKKSDITAKDLINTTDREPPSGHGDRFLWETSENVLIITGPGVSMCYFKLMFGRHHCLVDKTPSFGQFGESLVAKERPSHWLAVCGDWILPEGNLIVCWAKINWLLLIWCIEYIFICKVIFFIFQFREDLGC